MSLKMLIQFAQAKTTTEDTDIDTEDFFQPKLNHNFVRSKVIMRKPDSTSPTNCVRRFYIKIKEQKLFNTLSPVPKYLHLQITDFFFLQN